MLISWKKNKGQKPKTKNQKEKKWNLLYLGDGKRRLFVHTCRGENRRIESRLHSGGARLAEHLAAGGHRARKGISSGRDRGRRVNDRRNVFPVIITDIDIALHRCRFEMCFDDLAQNKNVIGQSQNFGALEDYN